MNDFILPGADHGSFAVKSKGMGKVTAYCFEHTVATSTSMKQANTVAAE